MANPDLAELADLRRLLEACSEPLMVHQSQDRWPSGQAVCAILEARGGRVEQVATGLLPADAVAFAALVTAAPRLLAMAERVAAMAAAGWERHAPA